MSSRNHTRFLIVMGVAGCGRTARAPWLISLHDLISFVLAQGQPGVLGYSALKDLYRQQLLEVHNLVVM